MWPFGDSDEKVSKNAAAQQETDRLVALSPADLASEVMPAFGPEGMEVKSGHQAGAMQVTSWLLEDFSGKVKYRQPVLGPTIEALGLLESAGLVTGHNFGSGNAQSYKATRQGLSALADGSVSKVLDSGVG